MIIMIMIIIIMVIRLFENQHTLSKERPRIICTNSIQIKTLKQCPYLKYDYCGVSNRVRECWYLSTHTYARLKTHMKKQIK